MRRRQLWRDLILNLAAPSTRDVTRRRRVTPSIKRYVKNSATSDAVKRRGLRLLARLMPHRRQTKNSSVKVQAYTQFYLVLRTTNSRVLNMSSSHYSSS